MSATSRICRESPAPDTTAFYVSAIDGDRDWLISGPYDTHQQALDDVDRVRELICAQDGRGHFMAWGTAGFRGAREEAPQGAANALLQGLKSQR